VAFALQDDGWFLRQDIIWAKPNPMPESVTDRCTRAHEYLFLLSKSRRYHFDVHAISEPGTTSARRQRRSVWNIVPKTFPGAHFATFPEELVEPCVLAGSRIGGKVLDPFLGSGTTAAVALALGRSAVGIELNPEYAELARNRIQQQVPLFAASDTRSKTTDDRSLRAATTASKKSQKVAKTPARKG
jgi:DNA modification methylase